MDVARVSALHVGDRLGVAEAGERVDVSVGVVAFDVSMLEDEEAIGAEYLMKVLISSRLRRSLRLGEKMQLAVVRSVPRPSDSMLPPSSTKGMRLTLTPLAKAWRAISETIRLSKWAGYFMPQPLKTKSQTTGCPSSMTVMPPWSRAQVSFVLETSQRAMRSGWGVSLR